MMAAYDGTRQMKLGTVLVPMGPGDEGGRHPISDNFDAAKLVETARFAEEALFDFLFREDNVGFEKVSLGYGGAIIFRPDALVAMAAVVGATSRIGLVATATSSFNVPYQLARQFLSLDHLSRGRVGWNVVTSATGERHYGLAEIPPQKIRYEQAAECLDIVHGVWDSWAPGSLRVGADGTAEVFPDLISEIDYHGRYYSSSGSIALPRSLQGRPVQFQAGASDTGKPFAGKYAEAIFSASPTFEHGQGIYREFHDMAARHAGFRAATGLAPFPLVTPGFRTVIEPTHDAAVERYRARFTDDVLNAARATLPGQFAGTDVSDLGLDDPVPAERLPDISKSNRRQSRAGLYRDLAATGAPLRKLLELHVSGNGHYTFAGSYDETASELERWFTGRACDGFVLMFDNSKDEFPRFVEHVLPRLQDRGLFRTAYESDTLRGNLGIQLTEPAELAQHA